MEHDGHDAGDVFSQELWDERYAAPHHVWSKWPATGGLPVLGLVALA